MSSLTRHGRQRGKDRLSLPIKATARVSARAFTAGQPPADFVGSFRRYLDGEAMKGNALVRVYGEHIYIFTADTVEAALITVLLVPPKFRRLLRRLRAEDQ